MSEREKLKDKNLALFFTYGVSLELWDKLGLLTRELRIYQELGKYFGKIYFVTYGKNDGKYSEELNKSNIEILPNKRYLPNFIYSLLIPLFYRRELKKCDFYKTNQMLGSWSAVLAKYSFKKKLIVRTGYTLSLFQRGNKIKYFFARLIEWISLKSADTVVVATKEESDYFARFGFKLKIIPNYVDTDLFQPMLEMKNKGDKKIILFVGRLSKQKNLENLFFAVKDIKSVKLQIIGSGELKENLKCLAAKEKIEVEFLENVPHEELPGYINHADIFVLPSLYEGNPKVLLEAMACGAVILATDVPGIKNVVKDRIDGFLCGPGASEIAAGLVCVLTVQENYSSISAAARKKIISQYSLISILDQELKNYFSL